MNDQINLEGKRILAVDDEPDVLDTLGEILSMCRLDTASSYEKARQFILESEDRQMIQDFSACLVGDFGKGIAQETRVEVGDVADRIVAFAQERETSMIVMSTHGRSGLISSLMGGVTERVLRRAPCPEFSVKPKEMEAAQS